MEQKEYALSFMNALQEGEEEKLYKFFTSRTKFSILKENRTLSLQEFIQYAKDHLCKKDFALGRVLVSKVCVKIEILNQNDVSAIYIETKDRRISLIEIL